MKEKRKNWMFQRSFKLRGDLQGDARSILETKESDVLESFQEGGLQEDGRIILETKDRMFYGERNVIWERNTQ